MQITEIPSAASDAWNIAEGVSQGKPSLLRYRPSLKKLLGDDRYPKVLLIEWRYDAANSSGMPNDPQTEEMRSLEDTLQSSLDVDRAAILAFIRTGSGVRTWHYYVSDLAEVGERSNQVLEPGLPIQLAVEDDPQWQKLSNVLKMCGNEL